MNRTPDLLITNELLYRLSYTGQAQNYTAQVIRSIIGADAGQSVPALGATDSIFDIHLGPPELRCRAANKNSDQV
jgi:hypothetical protein